MPPLQKMPPTPVLHTPRLVLRPVCSKDAPVIQRLFPQWDVVRWLDARLPWPYPPDGAATFIATCLDEMTAIEKSHWATVPKAAEAAGRVTDYAFRELGWPHLWLSNELDNHGSRRIKEKEGAQLVDLLIGRLVGGESSRMVWLLTRQTWMSRRTRD